MTVLIQKTLMLHKGKKRSCDTHVTSPLEYNRLFIFLFFFTSQQTIGFYQSLEASRKIIRHQQSLT